MTYDVDCQLDVDGAKVNCVAFLERRITLLLML